MIERAVTSAVEPRLPIRTPAEGVRASRLRLPTSLLVVAAFVLGAASLSASFAVRATAWAVMTDELQVARLATSIADTLSPVPRVHGVYYGALSQLYPLLIAPFFGILTPPAAATAAHALNALLLASAAWPAYVLARSVAGSRGAGYAAAALTAFTPWLVLASTLLTENAAYPAFVLAVLLCQRSLMAPSVGRDIAALAGLVLAFFARTQLFVLGLALPIAVVLHEVGYALLRPHEPMGHSVRAGLSRAITRHRLLAIVYLVAALAAGALAAAGSLGSVVGNYATPFHGNPLPAGFWHSAAAHFDQVAVGAGVVPIALGASWALTTFARPARKEAHAFAALLVVLVPLLTFEVTSFDLRFTPEQFIQDRYLFYLVPLFAVGSAAWLVQRTRRTFRLVTLIASGGALAALFELAAYDDRTILFWASPAAAFHPALASAAGLLDVSARTFLQTVTVVLVLAVATTAWRAPRYALLGTTLAVAGFGAFEAGYVFDREVVPIMTRPAAAPTRGWIDDTVPGGRSVALIPGGEESAVPWWEAELWNKNVDRVLRVDSGPTFTPFPVDDVSVDYERGRLRGAEPSDYLVISASETRFHLNESVQVADGGPLRLVRVDRPYRLDWATRGLTADAWTHPHELTAVRLYAQDRPGRRAVTMTLAALQASRKPIDFVLRVGSKAQYGYVDPGGARPPLRLTVCVPAGGFTDIWLTTNGSARLADGRVVALHMDRLTVHDAGHCASSQS